MSISIKPNEVNTIQQAKGSSLAYIYDFTQYLQASDGFAEAIITDASIAADGDTTVSIVANDDKTVTFRIYGVVAADHIRLTIQTDGGDTAAFCIALELVCEH